jgi:hypothetical protein
MKRTADEGGSLFRSEFFLLYASLAVLSLSVSALLDVLTWSRSSFGRFAFLASLILAPTLSWIAATEISVRQRRTVRMIGAVVLALLATGLLGASIILLPPAHD